MKNYTKIRKWCFKRHIKQLKERDNWNCGSYTNWYSISWGAFLSAPYKKIKTTIILEISFFLLFLINKTNITPNHVTFFGVFWVYLGSFFMFSDNNLLIYSSLLLFFTRQIPDAIDGSLAHLKNKFSKTGHELDLWLGDTSRIAFIIGVMFYIFNRTNDATILLLLISIIILISIDPRKYISMFKFSRIYYDKKLKGHSEKTENNSRNPAFSILKFFHYDGRTSYTDFVIFLILLDLKFNILPLLVFLSWFWLFMFSLAFLRSIYLVFKES